ncbi:MAG TPA: helix-hairpin-helix domain-containing protein [Phycisphaerae bacterium]|nr:helix-hairpin-helix domain-containing protein [Phycisphaerae bacterium]
MFLTESSRGWSNPQQTFLCFLLCLLLVFLTGSLLQQSVNAGAISSAKFSASLVELKIDPNTADYGSLIRLPDVGSGRARRLLAFREAQHTQTSAQPVFTQLADLERIPDFGPKTVENLAPLLTFPAPAKPQ